MAPRLQLHEVFKGFVTHVYFQPPPNVAMQYPCIVYSLDGASTAYAENRPYRYTKRYSVMVIDRNPDSDIPDKLVDLPLCSFNRTFAADSLNHFVFTLFF